MNFRFSAMSLTAAALLSLAFPLMSAQASIVVFDAMNGDPLDQGGVGTQQFDSTTGNLVALTTTDIIGYDAASSSFISATGGGPNHTTNIQTTNSAFGVNSASTPPGASSDARDFDNGEQWVFTFDEDVELVTIDLSGQSAGEVFQVSVAGGSTFSLPDGQTGDVHNLGNTLVTAGTAITFEATAGTGIRISQFTVDVQQAIPEPSSIALLSFLGLGVFIRRRR